MRRVLIVALIVALIVTVETLAGVSGSAFAASGVGSMKGKVVDSNSREPISGVCVQATLVKQLDGSAPVGRGSYKTTTGHDGTYRIPEMRSGQYLVVFAGCGTGKASSRRFASATFHDRDGLAPPAPPGVVDPTAPYAEFVRILDGVLTSGIDGRLAPGGTIIGRVVDSTGAPLAKVCAEARYETNWAASAQVVTAKDGKYAISGVLPHDLGTAGQHYSVLLLFTDCSSSARFEPSYFPEPVNFQTHRETVSVRDYAVGNDPSSCVLPGKPDRSVEGTTTSALRFENYTNVSSTVYWLDYAGIRVFYKTLAPGESYSQSTFLTHPWVVVGPDGRCLGYAVSTSASQTVRIF